jgi:hypothetical protein
MENATASSFVHAFNPSEPEHVLWLKQMNTIMDTMTSNTRVDLVKMANTNPMGVKMTNPLDWVFVHFSLAVAYTKAIFKGTAWVPQQK